MTFVDFTELSLNAQILYTNIEREMWIHNSKELYLTKEYLGWICVMSVPGIKVALRELKQKGYIIARNKNSCYLR